MPETGNESERMTEVDAHPDAHRPTEGDEEQVLRDLYGEPVQGVYTGVGE